MSKILIPTSHPFFMEPNSNLMIDVENGKALSFWFFRIDNNTIHLKYYEKAEDV
jgi:hypothetical protein